VGRVDKGAGFYAVSTNNYRINGGFAPLNPPTRLSLYQKVMAKAGVFIVDISALKCGVNGCEICSMRQY